MSTPLWTALIVVIALFLFTLILLLKSLIDRVIALLQTLNDKLSSIETECRPILKDVETTLSNLEPLTRELGDRGEEIGRMLGNVEKVTDDIQATTGAIRGGIVPIAHTLTGVFAGVMEGAKALGEHRRTSSTQVEINRGDE